MKQKILMILHLPPPVHGAAMMGKYLVESKIIRDSFDVSHINLSTSVKLDQIGKKGFHKIFASLKILARVVKALLRKRYDLCYVTLTSSSTGFYKDFLIVLILKLFNKRIVYHFHNKGISAHQERWVDNLLYRYAFRNTRSILLSRNLYVDFQKYVKTENVFFCANGIPLNQFVNQGIRDLRPGEPCKLLFLSHMMIEKGVITLLDACKVLRERGHYFECHFVGAWTNITQDEFKHMVKVRGIDKIVFAHGPKFELDKMNYFLNSDIFVFPTHNECFGLVLLEAMSFGLPVVATEEGGIPDIVLNDQTGFVIEKDNFTELASKLEILITKPELRREFGVRGKTRVTKHFTIDKFEHNMASILKDSLSNS
jgi:glycosyltransferase involved in cell wall biosynthesis